MAGYGKYLQKSTSWFEADNRAGMTSQKNPEACSAGCLILAFFDWMAHGFK